jgi:UDP-2-acetamido-2-deoxy-ribo-hexuluronate aminotransferase
VIEDAAQSFGAFYRGRRSCGLGTVGCTSFYPAKPLGSFGEGGALFTDDEALARTLRRIMNQGQSETYRHAMVGINGRLHALQAAVLRVKLAHLDDELAARKRVASEYSRELSEIADCGNIVLPFVREDRTSVYAQYTVRVSERDAFRGALHAWGIPTAIHYPLPMYRQEAYAILGQTYIEDTARRCPNCESSAAHVVSLPFGPFLQTADQQRVGEAIGEYERRRI